MNVVPGSMQMLGGRRTTRIVVPINFLLVGICLVPATRTIMEQIFGALEPYPFLPWFFDVWIVGSTLAVSALFVWDMAKKLRGKAAPERAPKGLFLDGFLLVAWWTTLLAICAYAFMIGMAA